MERADGGDLKKLGRSWRARKSRGIFRLLEEGDFAYRASINKQSFENIVAKLFIVALCMTIFEIDKVKMLVAYTVDTACIVEEEF